MKKSSFSIVFPVMNQADHIEKVIRSYRNDLKKNAISFELIAVVNGTTDASFRICQKLTQEFKELHAYELTKGGFGRGILYGAKKAKGEYICYLNCARVYPDELVTSLKYFLVNPEVIIHAIRKKRDVFYRRLSSLIYNTACGVLFGISSSDINGSPKIMSRENYKKLQLSFVNSMIDVEFVDKIKKTGISLIEIPIFKNIRHGGKSTSSFTTIFRLLKEVIFYWYKTRVKTLLKNSPLSF